LTAAAPTTRPAVPLVELSGSGDQMGTAQVAQLGDAIHTLHDKYLNPFMQSGVAKFVALSEANAFEAQLRPEHRAEVSALARSSHTDEREAMLGQCFLDIAQLSGCSTVALSADASPDGVARFGRNLDFWSLNVADKYTTLFVVHGDAGRYAYASVGWPGMIGVLSGMNEHGLCLANMEVPRPVRPPTAMPYPLLYRTVLERCRTVDDAIHLLQTTPRQTANNLMLMDAAGDRAVAEITPDGVHVRRPKGSAALISTNHQRDQDADTPGKCDRYDFLHAASAAEFGHVDEPAVTDLLRHVGRRGTLQSMVFEPAHRVLYLAAGQDATHRAYTRVDLTPYFDRR
jgi:isopenicillin-N N-acyltransferase-like protein